MERDLEAYQNDADEANASGNHLMAETLDDPSVTQQDLQELNESWDAVCQQAVSKRGSLKKAYLAAQLFEDGFDELVDWIDAESEELQSLPPPDEDVTILQQQIEEHKVQACPESVVCSGLCVGVSSSLCVTVSMHIECNSTIECSSIFGKGLNSAFEAESACCSYTLL